MRAGTLGVHVDDGRGVPPLEGERLVKVYGGMSAVDGMSITLRRGEILGVIGPNGAGKTTLFDLLAGRIRPSGGSVRIGGRDLTRAGADSRIAHGVGRTFQIPRPFAEMTVLENVLTGGQRQAGERVWMNVLAPGRVAAEEKAAVAKARALLEFVTLLPLQGEPARVLSGGQRKLLELARVLMADPAAILLDEPAAGVNPAVLELIIDRLRTLNAGGTSILLIEHNMDMVARICGRVVVMAAGRQVTEGAPEEVVRNPAVVDAYLGVAA